MKKYLYTLIGLTFLIGVVWLIVTPGKSSKPDKYDSFAQCLKDKGAIFYGAFWCPHCLAQKALFGRSVRFLPYVECSTPDGQGQLKVCKDVGITSYPTWQFNASSTEMLAGELSLATLAEKTNCELPK